MVLQQFGLYASDILILLVKFIYPSYASFKAIESPGDVDDTTWLIYWVVASIFTFCEIYILPFVSWVPFFMLARLLLYIWLQLPFFNGSIFLFNKFIKPFFNKNSSIFDKFLANNDQGLSKTVEEFKQVLAETYHEILTAVTASN